MAAPTSRIVGHKEWAKGRKVDPRYPMDWRRKRVAAVLRRWEKPPVTTTPDKPEDIMATAAELRAIVREELAKERAALANAVWGYKQAPTREQAVAYLERLARLDILLTRVDANMATALTTLASIGAGEDIDVDEIVDRITAALPDPEQLTDAIVARLDPDVDRAVVLEVLRELLAVDRTEGA